jgi:hypothetical protein
VRQPVPSTAVKASAGVLLQRNNRLENNAARVASRQTPGMSQIVHLSDAFP